MTFSELLDRLRGLGLRASENRVRYLLRERRINVPDKDGAGNYQWTELHFEQLEALLREKARE